ncbi:MAG TPA: response regulator [Acidobacteriaceae bacterium]|jgi:hypothetical protein|nr:response regulator [Acidobacteriaceae bacterium]
MTTESTQPPSEAGQSQALVPGQSQGHRRRRRRRKTKANLAAAQNGAQPVGQPAAPPAQTILQSGPPPQAPRPQQQGGPNQGQGSGRKKKKSRDRDRQPNFQASPGNSINASNGNPGNGNGGGKKRKQQKGPRQFVGPMDHSYRVANGNIADGPPSTIPFQGNGHGAYYNDPPPPRGAPSPVIAADAPTKIFFFIEDLFFLAKIQEASRKLGVKVEFVKGDKDVITRITDAPESERATLLVFDLNNTAAKPLTIIPKFKTKLKKSVSIIGFLSHLQGDLKAKATEAGCDTVMPRSAFSQSLPNLLRRYGMEEEEDYYPQPM